MKQDDSGKIVIHKMKSLISIVYTSYCFDAPTFQKKALLHKVLKVILEIGTMEMRKLHVFLACVFPCRKCLHPRW